MYHETEAASDQFEVKCLHLPGEAEKNLKNARQGREAPVQDMNPGPQNLKWCW